MKDVKNLKVGDWVEFKLFNGAMDEGIVQQITIPESTRKPVILVQSKKMRWDIFPADIVSVKKYPK